MFILHWQERKRALLFMHFSAQCSLFRLTWMRLALSCSASDFGYARSRAWKEEYKMPRYEKEQSNRTKNNNREYANCEDAMVAAAEWNWYMGSSLFCASYALLLLLLLQPMNSTELPSVGWRDQSADLCAVNVVCVARVHGLGPA